MENSIKLNGVILPDEYPKSTVGTSVKSNLGQSVRYQHLPTCLLISRKNLEVLAHNRITLLMRGRITLSSDSSEESQVQIENDGKGHTRETSCIL